MTSSRENEWRRRPNAKDVNLRRPLATTLDMVKVNAEACVLKVYQLDRRCISLQFKRHGRSSAVYRGLDGPFYGYRCFAKNDCFRRREDADPS